MAAVAIEMRVQAVCVLSGTGISTAVPTLTPSINSMFAQQPLFSMKKNMMRCSPPLPPFSFSVEGVVLSLMVAAAPVILSAQGL